ncbi:hypothetical protein BBJ28_00002676 [Nothophytophthora sp. Chile5]|nr:hypothetical protein BBJ28_00002676 [Nothophytophthora sp. Chile5]
MYVTRRLLRSTLPAEPPKTPAAEPEAPERALSFCLPPRRAAVRASAKICAVIAEASGNRVVKPATENGGDERNKRSHKKKKKPMETQVAVESAAKDTDSSVPLRGLELLVDVRYKQGAYAEARIMDLDHATRRVFVHYMGWNARYDAWVTPEDVAAHGSHTNAATKGAGWDGKTSLFASEADDSASQLHEDAPSEQKKKKRSALSPREHQAARRALLRSSPRPSSSKERKRSSEAVEEQRPPAKRTDRKSPKGSRAEAAKPTAASSRSNAAVKPETPVRRSTRRVHVAVGTTDEASERDETADLVLDVEIQGRHPSESSSDEAIDEEEEEEDEDAPLGRNSKRKKSKARKKASATVRQAEGAETVAEAKKKRDIDSKSHKAKKHKKAAAKSTGIKATRSVVVSKGGPPPRSSHGGLNSATREKLAAIFRLRVQQKQQMELMNAGQLSFQQSLQDEVMQAASAGAGSSPTSFSGASASSAAVGSSTAATDEYQRQLQQYYYHQQVLLASNLSMSASSSEDPSTMALQGGIMDPRIIQERLTALEERRRQQAHVQAYYRQLMLTRERNVRALAANQTFVSTSAAAWQQQMKELQKEDGAASVKSWKDVTDTLSASDKEAGGGENDSPSTGSGEAVEASESGGEGDESPTDSVGKNETRPAAVAPGSSGTASPDVVEKAAEGDPTAGKGEEKSDPTAGKPATEGEGVLYEFVL